MSYCIFRPDSNQEEEEEEEEEEELLGVISRVVCWC